MANDDEVAPTPASGTRRRTVGPAEPVAEDPAEHERTLRELLSALEAVAEGDFSARMPTERTGLPGEVARAFNAGAERRARLDAELARVARVVGREGRMAERVIAPGGGDWAEGVTAVNALIEDLVRPTTEVGRVLEAVARGDLTQHLSLTIDGQPLRGEFQRIGTVVNTMVDQLSAFADEVTRVAREVGTEGRLGGQAAVPGVSGTWKALTDNVNELAGNLTAQVRGIAQVTTAVAQGDLSQKITVDARGEIAELKETVNTMVDQLGSFADEVTRVAREVGTEGRLGGQASVRGVSGTWEDLTDSVNLMASNLTTQVRGIAQVSAAIARGDLDQRVEVEAAGEVAALADTINSTTDTLRAFADEVTRVAREVGTEGRLGGQADVPGVAGTWKALTDSVNVMAGNLTAQVRGIAQVTDAVARGDLAQRVQVDAAGEVAALAETINSMTDTLRAFADEVTRVAREVGTEGKLGGQAEVPGVAGTWRRLTESVNSLARNLTTQVRAIAEVSSAVTSGDLTRSITVEAEGEVEELKDTINQMIANLRETTQRTRDQDWRNSNLARISARLQGQRDLRTVAQLIVSELVPLVDAQHGALYLAETPPGGEVELRLVAGYGEAARPGTGTRWRVGEGLVGQAVLERRRILVRDLPPDYVRVRSGLGEASPEELVVLPVLFEGEVLAVIELASLRSLAPSSEALLDQIVDVVGVALSTIRASSRTEELLVESQRLTQELQTQSEELQAQQDELRRSNAELEDQARSLRASEELLQTQQEELQGTNAELEEKAAQLVEQKQAIEVKNTEIELARRAIEERAEQLSVSSRYKSEFLANMSHELRTPLNSLLILAKLLADNPAGNLTEKQVEFAQSIHGAGADLLTLISDILDLSKVEAGKLEVAPTTIDLESVVRSVTDVFQPLADQKGITLEVAVDGDVPALTTDGQRLSQVLNNLLGNAVKFTEAGRVALRICVAEAGAPRSVRLGGGGPVIAFEVSDTGIGIPADKLDLIFEAFQQADGTTSRRYGGTGLGLSISREIARLLGGELQVRSTPGEGSTFTLLLPPTLESPATADDAPARRVAAPRPAEAVAALPAGDEDDDREAIEDGDRVLLLVADDEEVLAGAADAGRERGFKVVVGRRGDLGLALARELRPDAIVLDAQLPGVDGIAVLEELKRLPETRHIPVHLLSAGGQRQTALSSGAIAYLEKPVSPDDLARTMGQLVVFLDAPVRRLLVVEDDERERDSIIELVTGGAVDIEAVGAGDEGAALAALEAGRFDCMVLDLKLGGRSGFDLLERVKGDARWADMPVIVYTGRALDRREETRLKKYAETIIVKDVRSPERLLDETALFLHRVESRLPKEKRRMIEQLHSADSVFEGRRVLIVDDDVRNVFALTSAFEGRGMEVLFAENGREGLAVLAEHPDVDLVLMDIMMPEMDGYEAMRAIRAQEAFERLPVIALTAKAMKGDRELSVAAGASDYITKPVDVDQLLSLMRVWLYR